MRRELYPNNLFSSSVTRVARATFPAGEGSFYAAQCGGYYPPLQPKDNSRTTHLLPKVSCTLASPDCQAKCNTFFKKSFGDKNPRHLRGRLLIRETTASNCSCVTLLKSVPLGKKKRTNPFMFSLLPRCQGA